MESIKDIALRYLDEIYEAQTDEDVEEVLCALFTEGYYEGFSSAIEERIENDLILLRYLRNER